MFFTFWCVQEPLQDPVETKYLISSPGVVWHYVFLTSFQVVLMPDHMSLEIQSLERDDISFFPMCHVSVCVALGFGFWPNTAATYTTASEITSNPQGKWFMVNALEIRWAVLFMNFTWG
jgi:hypothetical protein